MTKPQIHPRRTSFAVSKAVETVGQSIQDIRREDGLTWADMGRVLGKCDDRARDYATAVSEMPLSAFLLGCREWNGRFAGPVLAMIGMKLVDLDAGQANDRHILTSLTKLLLELSVALEDGDLGDDELAAMHRVVDEAGQAVDQLRERLKVRAA